MDGGFWAAFLIWIGLAVVLSAGAFLMHARESRG